MIRAVTQLLVGLMLFFGVVTLLPKAIFDMRAGRYGHAVKYAVLGLLALFFSLMAFYYAYLLLRSS